jgi:hypothetical protein
MVGKQGVKVLVDGKPSALAESNLQAFLKSIPANTIESIEPHHQSVCTIRGEWQRGYHQYQAKEG